MLLLLVMITLYTFTKKPMNKYTIELEVQGNLQIIRVLRNGDICETIFEDCNNDGKDYERLQRAIEKGKKWIDFDKLPHINEVIFESPTRTITKMTKGKMVWLWLQEGKNYATQCITNYEGKVYQSYESALFSIQAKTFEKPKTILYETC